MDIWLYAVEPYVRGSELLAKQCVAIGVNLEEVDAHGQTALFWAAARGNMVVVDFLLQLGFEINLRDYASKTTLFFERAAFLA